MPYTLLFPFLLQAQDSVGHIDLNKSLLLEGISDLKRPGKNNHALSQKKISTRDSKQVATCRLQKYFDDPPMVLNILKVVALINK